MLKNRLEGLTRLIVCVPPSITSRILLVVDSVVKSAFEEFNILPSAIDNPNPVNMTGAPVNVPPSIAHSPLRVFDPE